MTWNVAHIANAVLRRRVEDICRAAAYDAPNKRDPVIPL
jgi:hypothetical protein